MRLATQTGRPVRLGARLGRGGEGCVHAVDGSPGLAAKIYHPWLAFERREKVRDMVGARWHASTPVVAFPIDSLHDAAGDLVGFTMRRMAGHKPAHGLYSPLDRKLRFPRATYPFLVRAMANTARAVAGVHATGCVIGDLNESGVLVSDQAEVVLIDSDSFQVGRGAGVHPCRVIKGEFTAPELVGRDIEHVLLTPSHDAFALAVLIFYTLMMGHHPFDGRSRELAELAQADAIKAFRFAYSLRPDTRMRPPLQGPTLAEYRGLPPSVTEAFENAFAPSGAAGGRPSAAEWAGLLERAEGDLVPCPLNPLHHHFRHAARCPWCRMERDNVLFEAFAPPVPMPSGAKAPALAGLVTAVNSVADPGDAPDLGTVLGARPTSASPLGSTGASRGRRLSAACVGALAAAALVGALKGGLGRMEAALTLAAAMPPLGWWLHASLPSPGRKRRALDAWERARREFSLAAGNARFKALRSEADILVWDMGQLPAEEKRKLNGLEAARKDRQSERHLQSHRVDATVPGVGSDQVRTLRSQGIRTAADVPPDRPITAQGLTPSARQALQDWRRKVDAAFRYDPNEGVDPGDLAAMRAGMAERRTDVELRMSQLAASLRNARTRALAARSDPGPAARAAWQAWDRERTVAGFLKLTVMERSIALVLAAATFCVATGVPGPAPWQRDAASTVARAPAPSAAPPHNLSSGTGTATAPSPRTSEHRPGTVQPGPSPPAWPRPEQAVTPATQEPRLDLLSRGDAARVQERLRSLGYFRGTADGLWGPLSRAALRDYRRTQRLGRDDRWDAATEGALLAEGAARSGSAVPDLPVLQDTSFAPPAGATRNPLNQPDAAWAQARLRELGYYAMDRDGVWGAASRDALRDFKLFNDLPADEAWNGATEQKLGGGGQIGAGATFIGQWTAEPGDCTDTTSVTTRRASIGASRCDFGDVVRTGPGWSVRARCTSQGRTWSANVELAVNGDRLTWRSERGSQEYHRCR